MGAYLGRVIGVSLLLKPPEEVIWIIAVELNGFWGFAFAPAVQKIALG